MKWPLWLGLIRHDTSLYNVLKGKKKKDPLYLEFLKEFKKNPESETTRALARLVSEKHALGVSDAETPLADKTGRRPFAVGKAMRKKFGKKGLPDIIFVSPYLRTWQTLAYLIRGWPELDEIKIVEEERIREQEHGLSLLYNDWRVFHALHPEQGRLFRLEGAYWYRYPQGENVPDVRARDRSWTTTLIREFAGKKILAITHHLNILGVRANFERWGSQKFIHVDETDKPDNCSLTVYEGNPNKGKNGRFELKHYNWKLW